MKVLIHWIDEDGYFHVAQYDNATFVKVNQTSKEHVMMEHFSGGYDGALKFIEGVEIFKGNPERKV